MAERQRTAAACPPALTAVWRGALSGSGGFQASCRLFRPPPPLPGRPGTAKQRNGIPPFRLFFFSQMENRSAALQHPPIFIAERMEDRLVLFNFSKPGCLLQKEVIRMIVVDTGHFTADQIARSPPGCRRCEPYTASA